MPAPNGMPDRFVAVEIENNASSTFDAAQYSFFGDLDLVGGALEDGLEGPPPEEGLSPRGYGGLQETEDEIPPSHVGEDLSLATLFRNQFGLASSKRHESEEDAGLDSLLKDPLSAARKHLQGSEYDDGGREMGATGRPSSAAADAGSPHRVMHLSARQDSNFPALGSGFNVGISFLQQAAPMSVEPSAGAALLAMVKKPSTLSLSKVLTLEELEARMLSNMGPSGVGVNIHDAGQRGVPPVVAAMVPQAQMPSADLPSLHGQPMPVPTSPQEHFPGHYASPQIGSRPHEYVQPHMLLPLQQHGDGRTVPHGIPGPMWEPGLQHDVPVPQHMLPPPRHAGQIPHARPHPCPGPPPALMYGSPPPLHPVHPSMVQHSSGGPALGQPMAPPIGRVFGQTFIGPGPVHGPPFVTPRPGFANAGLRGAPIAPPLASHGAVGRPALQGPSVPGSRPSPPSQQGHAAMSQIGQQLMLQTEYVDESAGGVAPTEPGGQQASRAWAIRNGGVSAPVALAATAAAAGRAGGSTTGPGGRLGGKWMRPDDLEYVVRSMLYSVANGVPYVEDYYYQAFVQKHVPRLSRQQLSPGAFPMAAPFVPEALRELSQDALGLMRLDPRQRAKFVEGVQGLGKIVLSNIRTPKVLMDLTDRSHAASGGAAKAGPEPSAKGEDIGRSTHHTRPLEQEPLLAARIMLEDCLNLLLDLDDVDRLALHVASLMEAKQRTAGFAAGVAVPGGDSSANMPSVAPFGQPATLCPPPQHLRERRLLLLAGVNGAFRLPDCPQGAESRTVVAADAVAEDADDMSSSSRLGDGVFLSIMALSKGRSMVARALLAIAPPGCLDSYGPSGNAYKQRADGLILSIMGGPGSRAAQPRSRTLEGQSAPGLTEDATAGAASAPITSPFVLLWATLRHSWSLFSTNPQQGSDPAAERHMLDATVRLAASLRDCLIRLPSARDVVDAVAAFNSGCDAYAEALGELEGPGAMLLPLAQTRSSVSPSASSAWLGEALAALVTRAGQLGLVASAGVGEMQAIHDAHAEEESNIDSEVRRSWRREYRRLHARLERHLRALAAVHSIAAGSDNDEALAVVRSLCSRPLMQAMLLHGMEAEAAILRQLMQLFTMS